MVIRLADTVIRLAGAGVCVVGAGVWLARASVSTTRASVCVAGTTVWAIGAGVWLARAGVCVVGATERCTCICVRMIDTSIKYFNMCKAYLHPFCFGTAKLVILNCYPNILRSSFKKIFNKFPLLTPYYH